MVANLKNSGALSSGTFLGEYFYDMYGFSNDLVLELDFSYLMLVDGHDANHGDGGDD